MALFVKTIAFLQERVEVDFRYEEAQRSTATKLCNVINMRFLSPKIKICMNSIKKRHHPFFLIVLPNKTD